MGKRFEAYGWYVQHVNGHDPDEVRNALDEAVSEQKRPSLIVARTHIGIGAPTKQDSPEAHGSPLGAEEIAGAKKAAGWPVEPAFRIPDGARAPFQKRVEEVRPQYQEWKQKLGKLSGEQAARWRAFAEREVPAEVLTKLLDAAEPQKGATRALASKVEQRLAELVPALVGGSADLNASTKTDIKGGGGVARGEFGGRNVHFGIREHGMGAILNGLALSGFFIPLGSTFLIFSDYMRPSMRLAALMEQQVVYVFTHDSVFLGEDGPTHQPVEQVTSLRLIPNLDVVRPADALECAAAWAHAATRRHGPTALVLSRQKLPTLTRPEASTRSSCCAGPTCSRTWTIPSWC